MPFTLSHAAAAWPVRRIATRLPLDALVIGTMAPDYEYVLRLAVVGRLGHTPMGLLAFCLPVSLAALALWRTLVRPALLPLVPHGLIDASRLDPARSGLPSILLPSSIAILLGAVTHVAWDGFTHRTGWAVSALPALLDPAPGIGRPWYNVLQHASTLFGAIVIVLWIGRWVRSRPPRDRRFAPGPRGRLVRVAALLIGGASVAAIVNGSRAIDAGPERMLGCAAVGGMAGLAVTAVAYGVYRRMIDRPG